MAVGKGTCLGICLCILGLASGLGACAPGPTQLAPSLSPALTPASTPSPSATPASSWASLSACQWVDVYDPDFILTFDPVAGEMVEENQPAGICTVYRIGLSANAILLYDHVGRISQTLPYSLVDQRLSIDYGQPLGVLEYQPRP